MESVVFTSVPVHSNATVPNHGEIFVYQDQFNDVESILKETNALLRQILQKNQQDSQNTLDTSNEFWHTLDAEHWVSLGTGSTLFSPTQMLVQTTPGTSQIMMGRYPQVHWNLYCTLTVQPTAQTITQEYDTNNGDFGVFWGLAEYTETDFPNGYFFGWNKEYPESLFFIGARFTGNDDDFVTDADSILVKQFDWNGTVVQINPEEVQTYRIHVNYQQAVFQILVNGSFVTVHTITFSSASQPTPLAPCVYALKQTAMQPDQSIAVFQASLESSAQVQTYPNVSVDFNLLSIVASPTHLLSIRPVSHLLQVKEIRITYASTVQALLVGHVSSNITGVWQSVAQSEFLQGGTIVTLGNEILSIPLAATDTQVSVSSIMVPLATTLDLVLLFVPGSADATVSINFQEYT